jgi:hypothetical protein
MDANCQPYLHHTVGGWQERGGGGSGVGVGVLLQLCLLSENLSHNQFNFGMNQQLHLFNHGDSKRLIPLMFLQLSCCQHLS